MVHTHISCCCLFLLWFEPNSHDTVVFCALMHALYSWSSLKAHTVTDSRVENHLGVIKSNAQIVTIAATTQQYSALRVFLLKQNSSYRNWVMAHFDLNLLICLHMSELFTAGTAGAVIHVNERWLSTSMCLFSIEYFRLYKQDMLNIAWYMLTSLFLILHTISVKSVALCKLCMHIEYGLYS